MNSKQYQDAIQFFMDETGCTAREARQMASNADTIIFNAKNDSESFRECVLFGIRNAYFLGQEN